MVPFVPWMLAAVVLSSFLSGCVLWLFYRFVDRDRYLKSSKIETPTDSFLIRNGSIVDHALQGLGSRAEFLDNLTAWTNFRSWLATRFSNLPEDLSTLEPEESKTFLAHNKQDYATVTISATQGGHLVALRDPQLPHAAEWHQALQRMELNAVRLKSAEDAPCAICKVDQSGHVLWRNAAFRQFTESETSRLLEAAHQYESSAYHLVTLRDDGTTKSRHFELRIVSESGRRVLYATDVTRLVQADTVRGAFIQTPTKTFADLATGLAVFDRQRQLVLFNPAIIDLTGLTAEFLIGRPDLMEFFDRLRDKQVLPEPKSYADWRAQISGMINSASDGHYAEAWSLPNGLTYRVTGRPHPDGAVAFLIEDISDEISLTRRSRSQLEIRQAVIDRLDEAITVIGPNGLVVFCNKAFRDLLCFDPDSSFSETSFDDLLSVCRTCFPESRFWGQLAQDIADSGTLKPSGAILNGGAFGPMRCRIEPLPGGFAMMSLARAETPLLVSS